MVSRIAGEGRVDGTEDLRAEEGVAGVALEVCDYWFLGWWFAVRGRCGLVGVLDGGCGGRVVLDFWWRWTDSDDVFVLEDGVGVLENGERRRLWLRLLLFDERHRHR